MKKSTVVFVMCTLIACSILTIPITAADPTVLLPSGAVGVTAQYGSIYWFDFTLSGVPADVVYDVENGIYHGWCVDKDLEMSRGVPHQVNLKSSLDLDLPNGFSSVPWNEINYIINHRDGYSRNNVQIAIWHLTDNVNLTGYDDSQALVDDAEQNGGDFIPQIGDLLAIPIVAAVSWIQPAFLELIIPPPTSIRGFVWYDTNGDGIQDTGESGLGDITVTLYNNVNVSIDETHTTSEGYYTFRSFEPGDYYLKFSLKTGYVFTKEDIGDDATDSDANTITGKTIIFTVPANQNVSITDWDAGMYKKSSGGTPAPPEEVTTPNVLPVADLTKGAPYQGFINSTITFNGSHSYDTDGRIIAYRWNFGDGSPNGTGEITTHLYTTPGDYNVSLLVTDNDFATSIDTTIAHITLGNNPPSVPELSGPVSGRVGVSSQYTVLSSDPEGDNLQYVINWGDGLQETSPAVMSGQSYQFNHQWTTTGFYQIKAYAKDTTYENKSGNVTMAVAIDVKYVGNLGYLIDRNGDGIFDQFYNNATGLETGVNQQTSGKYLIDSNGDGTYDLLYDTASGQTQPFSEQPLVMYLIIIILVILIIVFLLIFYSMRKRKRPQQ